MRNVIREWYHWYLRGFNDCPIMTSCFKWCCKDCYAVTGISAVGICPCTALGVDGVIKKIELFLEEG